MQGSIMVSVFLYVRVFNRKKSSTSLRAVPQPANKDSRILGFLFACVRISVCVLHCVTEKASEGGSE